MKSAVKVKPKQVTKTDAVLATKNSIRIALSCLSYVRSLFPDNVFRPKLYCGVELMVFRKEIVLGPEIDAGAHQLLLYLEKGVFHAFENRYVERILFNIHDSNPDEDDEAGKVIESYSFKIAYREDGEVKAGVAKTQEDIRCSTQALLKRLIMLTSALPNLPADKWLSINLMYNDRVPKNYQPPFFEDMDFLSLPRFKSDPLAIKVGEADTGFNTLILKLRRPDDQEDNPSPNATLPTFVPSTVPKDIGYDSDDADISGRTVRQLQVSRENRGESDVETEVSTESEDCIVWSRQNLNLQKGGKKVQSKRNVVISTSQEEYFVRSPKAPRYQGNKWAHELKEEDTNPEPVQKTSTTKKQSTGNGKTLMKSKTPRSEDDEVICGMEWSQDSFCASQENVDPARKISRSRSSIHCMDETNSAVK